MAEASVQPKVLLVDDDDLLSESVAEFLRRYGYDVQVAREGRKAMDLLARQRFALVISDIFMPEVDGIELLGLLRRCTPTPAVIAMSGSGVGRVECMLKMASVLGASRTLGKPFQPAHLIRLVQELIGPGVVRAAGYPVGFSASNDSRSSGAVTIASSPCGVRGHRSAGRSQ